jgi:hypothetical protein
MSIENLIKDAKSYNDGIEQPGISSIIKLFGNDKIDDVFSKFKNIKNEDIKSTADSIQEFFLNSDVDDDTKQTLAGLCNFVKDSIDEHDLSQGDITQNLLNVTKSVAHKYKKSGKMLDKDKLLQIAQNLSGNMKDNEGKNIFEGLPFNPLNIINDFNKGNLSEADCMQKCEPIFQSMGISKDMINSMFNSDKMFGDDIFNPK